MGPFVLIDRHADRIGLLSAGTGGRPDTQLLETAQLVDLRQQLPVQYLVGVTIPKPERFVGGHGVDDPLLQPVRARSAQPLDQLSEGGAALLPHDSAQPTLHQILLVFRQQDTAALFKENAELLKILRGNTETLLH